jgi:hypothetical protein
MKYKNGDHIPASVKSRFPAAGAKAAASPIKEASVPSARGEAATSFKGYPVDQVKAHKGKMTT